MELFFVGSSHAPTAAPSHSLFGSKTSSQMGLDPWNLNQSVGFQQKVGEFKSIGGFGDFSQQGGFDDFARPMMESLGVGLEPYLEIHQLDPVPVYYEKYSSFYTPSRPEVLLRDMTRKKKNSVIQAAFIPF